MEIKHRLPSVEEYRKLRSLVGWWETDEDGGLYFYIQDLIVQPDYQSKGIGTAIMNELMAYIKTSAKPGSYIALMAAKGYEKYYEFFGFEARKADAPGMYQVI